MDLTGFFLPGLTKAFCFAHVSIYAPPPGHTHLQLLTCRMLVSLYLVQIPHFIGVETLGQGLTRLKTVYSRLEHDLGCSSPEEYLPKMPKTLDSIPELQKTKQNKQNPTRTKGVFFFFLTQNTCCCC
jgi:hypothetical protein